MSLVIATGGALSSIRGNVTQVREIAAITLLLAFGPRLQRRSAHRTSVSGGSRALSSLAASHRTFDAPDHRSDEHTPEDGG